MGAIDPRYPPPKRLLTAEHMLQGGMGAWRSIFAGLTDQQIAELGNPLDGPCSWKFWGRDEQIAPTGDWATWLYLAGRGTGKTRSGAEWVLQKVREGTKIIHLIAPTEADYRDVMVNGPAGIVTIAPEHERPRYVGQHRRVEFPNGAYAICFAAERPERLRGPQCEAAWCDEIAAWRYVDHTWDMMSFGLRLGVHPQVFISTTPKPIPLLKKLVVDPTCALTKGTTYDNRPNLAKSFFEKTVSRYDGTRLGRQELMAEILGDNPDALFNYTQLDKTRIRLDALPALRRIVVAVDPPASTGEDADECGIIVAGLGEDGEGYLLADCSSKGDAPLVWAKKVLRAYSLWNANQIIVEVNQGGAMVRSCRRCLASWWRSTRRPRPARTPTSAASSSPTWAKTATATCSPIAPARATPRSCGRRRCCAPMRCGTPTRSSSR